MSRLSLGQRKSRARSRKAKWSHGMQLNSGTKRAKGWVKGKGFRVYGFGGLGFTGLGGWGFRV